MGLISVILSIFVIISLLIYNFFRRRQFYWKNRNVPHIEGDFFYGSGKGVGRTISSGEFFKQIYFKSKSIGPLVGFNMYFQPMVMITDPDLMKTILIKEFNKFPNRGGYHNEKDDPASANLAMVENEQWKSLRNKLTPSFTSGKIKLMFPILCEISDRFIDRIALESEEKSSLEVKDLNSRFTTDVIAKAAFGIECNSLEDSSTNFYQMGLKAFSDVNFFKRNLTLFYPNVARKLHVTVSNFEVANFYRDVVEQTIKYREENNVQRNDFMQMLIKMMNQPNDPLSFNEVWTQSITFFLGGFETTATTLTYCLYELSQSKDIQKKARESVKNILDKHNGEYTYEVVSEMQYIEQCINGKFKEINKIYKLFFKKDFFIEALRLHPPAVATRRISTQEYRVPDSKIVLEIGTPVIIPIAGMNYDPEIYEDPTKYDPDRFSPEEEAKRHNFVFLPFGEGPRVSC